MAFSVSTDNGVRTSISAAVAQVFDNMASFSSYNAADTGLNASTSCPPSQYDNVKVDSSVWTYITCYALAAIGITLSILLLAMSSTASPATSSSSSYSSSTARRRLAREEKKKKKKRQKQKEQQQSNRDVQNPVSHNPLTSSKPYPFINQSSSLGGQQESIQQHSIGVDEPSMKSWRSYEESQMSLYLDDGTISTNVTNKGEDREATSNPTSSLPGPRQISLGSAPAELFPTPSTAENSDPDSDNSTLTTLQDQRKKSTNLYNDFYMTLLVCYFVFQSISYLVAGFGHMAGQDFTGKMPNRVIHGTAAFAACSLFAVAISEYLTLLANQKKQRRQQSRTTRNEGDRNHDGANAHENSRPSEISTNNNGNKTILCTSVWLLCSLPAVVVFVILDLDLYTSIFLGVSHFSILLTALFRVCFSEQRFFLVWYLVDAAAMLFYIIGLTIQLYLEAPCGYDGYKEDCFADCPLPPSSATPNHNAIFHLFALASLLLYGCSKMVQMQLPKDTPRSSAALSTSAISTQPSTPARNHISGAAAAILMQDHTIEV